MSTTVSDRQDLLRDWNYEKNGILLPSEVSVGSNKKIWWKCEKGHEWEASPHNRSKGRGCPICSNKLVLIGYNDLATKNPQLSFEWNYEKNGSLLPTQVSIGSSKKVWWKCEKGHEWEASVNSRTKLGTNCPFCSGRKSVKGTNDLATVYPDIAKEWNYEKNIDLRPEDIGAYSSQKVWWKCEKGHEWQATVNNRTGVNKTGCPVCSNRVIIRGINDLATTNPKVLEEWNYEKNVKVSPYSVGAGTNQKVWWKCSECGNEWKSPVRAKVEGRRCPICDERLHSSFPEKSIFYYVKQQYPNAVSRYTELFTNRMEIDIFIPELTVGIEYDGSQWHSTPDQIRREKNKYSICQNNGVKLIRVKEKTRTEHEDYCDYTIYINPDPSNEELTNAICSLATIVPLDLIIDVERDKDEIELLVRSSLRESSLAYLYPEIASQWNYEKNGLLKPDYYSPGNTKSVWWKCEKGHEWKTAIAGRTLKGSGCPYCAGQRVIKGENDLLTCNPELAKEWNYDRNGSLSPDQTTQFTMKKVWWKCEKGHEWEASISNRSKGTGCPVCSNQKVLAGYNDLASFYPNLISEWDYDKNGRLLPTEVTCMSNKKVWWKCEKGHEWEAKISNRAKGSKCPYCCNQRVWKGENDFGTLAPELAENWDYSKNINTSPYDFVLKSNKKVWWKCRKCGHEYYRSLAETVKRKVCPKCKQ
ncbi:MAG: hypothetical protein IKF24_04240 [Eubacterium sp.]|nr:hypothetical protein [Eubacterium sp.]